MFDRFGCAIGLLAIFALSGTQNSIAQVCQIPQGFPLKNITTQIDPVFQNLHYPQNVGWIGGDNGHTIPLTETKVLWLFSDTLIGTVQSGQRTLEAFINNSIGIQDMSAPGPGSIEYYWDTSGGGNNSFFPHQTGTPGQWYWPFSGVMLDGELFIFCASIQQGGNGFGDNAVTTIIRIPNPLDPPDSWIQNGFDMGIPDVYSGQDFSFPAATFIEEPYLYVLMLTGNGGFGNQQIGRALISDLQNGGLGEVFEYWTSGPGGPSWRSSMANLVTLFSGGVTETEIHHEKSLGLYLTFTYNVFDRNVTLRTAENLTGPWSAEACIYQVPEVGLDPSNIIMYEVRSHPELSSTPGEVVLTYLTNWIGPSGFNNLFTPAGLEIYWPHFLRLRFDAPSGVTGWTLYK